MRDGAHRRKQRPGPGGLRLLEKLFWVNPRDEMDILPNLQCILTTILGQLIDHTTRLRNPLLVLNTDVVTNISPPTNSHIKPEIFYTVKHCIWPAKKFMGRLEDYNQNGKINLNKPFLNGS